MERYYVTVSNLSVREGSRQLVIESNDINTSWDGQFRKQNTIEGVFAWVLEYHDGLEYHIQNGDITILR